MKDPSDVIAAFTAKGYRRFPPADSGDVALLEKRVEARPCITNDRCAVHVMVHAYGENLSVGITGEYAPDLWATIKVYGVRWSDITPSVIDRIEADVVRAWNAIHGAPT